MVDITSHHAKCNPPLVEDCMNNPAISDIFAPAINAAGALSGIMEALNSTQSSRDRRSIILGCHAKRRLSFDDAVMLAELWEVAS